MMCIAPKGGIATSNINHNQMLTGRKVIESQKTSILTNKAGGPNRMTARLKYMLLVRLWLRVENCLFMSCATARSTFTLPKM